MIRTHERCFVTTWLYVNTEQLIRYDSKLTFSNKAINPKVNFPQTIDFRPKVPGKITETRASK